MPIELKMPALSPTMEEGTLAKWLVKVGDSVRSGDILAEIETDKATMEFEAIDEGTIAEIVVPEGTDGVKVGTVIARISGEGEAAGAPAVAATVASPTPAPTPAPAAAAGTTGPEERGYGANPVEDAEVAKVEAAAKAAPVSPPAAPKPPEGARVIASPLAKRIASQTGVDLATITGSGPNGRIVKADVEGAGQAAPMVTAAPAPAAAPVQASAPALVDAPAPAAPKPTFTTDVPHEAVKLSNIRKTIARRLTESKQTIPHIYLTLDVRLDAMLKLRGELNGALAARGIKLSVNDMLVKALALSLIEVPACNVSFTPDTVIKYGRADISVAVSTPTGLITPIVVGADTKSLSAISVEVKDLAARARDNKLKPEEYQGGTASISNMGMYGITQFDAVINPPQAMILAVGAGERRPVVAKDPQGGDALGIATVMTVTGSFDHRAIDGADGAQLMQALKALCENPLGLVA